MTSFNVLSLFDGIGCGRAALARAGIDVTNYFACEIKDYAIACARRNWPDIIEIGDVTNTTHSGGKLISDAGRCPVRIDLLIGGSPCQNFSVANSYQSAEEYGLNGPKSSLFYEYLRLLKEVRPRWFLLENVRMRKESELAINKMLGVDGVLCNSSLVSAQNRARIYWTNIPFLLPQDKGIKLASILETDAEHLAAAKVHKTPSRDKMWYGGKCKNITGADKSSCLTRKQDRWNNAGLLAHEDYCRFLTPVECERLQTLPDGYTEGLTTAQRYDVLGDGWTVDMVAHIFSTLKA